MSVQTIEVIEPGILTTVQDRGRYGYQRYGVPVSGAMDVFSLRAANILAGNDQGAACLEMTVLGPKLRFLSNTWIAVTGADLSPVLDGESILSRRSVEVSEGAVLRFDGAGDGVRGYLAVAGGIDVPLVMGSRSTYVNGSIGGFEGRQLRAGDILYTPDVDDEVGFVERVFPDRQAVTYGREHEIRVAMGPQEDAFTAEAIAVLLDSAYTVSIQSDRMGYRLEGPVLEHRSGPDVVSDGSPLGAIQVPGDGHPIILLADRGTTGGYAKIATVIAVDIGRLAQALPGDTVRFRAATVEEGHALLRQQEDILSAVQTSARQVMPARRLSVVVDGEAFEVTDEAGDTLAVPEVPTHLDGNGVRRVKATVDGRTYEFEVQVDLTR